MRHLALASLGFSLSLLGCSQPAPEGQAERPKPAVGDAEREPAADAAKPAPAPAPAIVYYVDEQLWRVEPDGSGARALGLELSPHNPGHDEAISEGESVPTVSPDGRWIAWADELDLWVAELAPEGPKRAQITRMPKPKPDELRAASISFSTWSPDSTTLLVVLREPGSMDLDPLPLPDATRYGVHTLTAGASSLTAAPHITGFSVWTPDSKAVIDNDFTSDDSGPRLVQRSIAPGPAKVLQAAAEKGYGWSQLSAGGEWLVWMETTRAGSQVLVADMTGSDPKPMSPLVEFAEIQWPKVAPDGAHVVYTRKDQSMLGSGADEAASEPLPQHGDLRWFDAGQLLAITGEGLVLMSLDGQTRVLDANASGLVRQ